MKDIYCSAGYRRFLGLTFKVSKYATEKERKACIDYMAYHQDKLACKHGMRLVLLTCDNDKVVCAKIINWHTGEFEKIEL